jgi:predicted PurR-regulated permease PerM
MNLILKKRLFWIAIFVVFAVIVYSVSGILFPFIAGVMVAYFLDPATDKLVNKGLSRNLATCAILGTFILIVTALLLIVSPLIYEQLKNLAENLPAYFAKINENYGAKAAEILHRFDPEIESKIQTYATEFSGQIFDFTKKILANVLTGGAAIFNLASLILITPIVSFYFLRDWDIMLAKLDDILPRENIATIRMLATKIDNIISAYIRGQLLVCISLGIFYAIALSLAGLNYGFAIGLLTGIFSFIPYVGMVLGTIIGLIVAYFQFGFDYQIVLILGVFIAGNILEGNFLSPKIVGDKVNLHAVWIIFALLAGGSLMGLTGVILAIPVAAVIGVLVRHFIEVYKQSNYFN